MSHSSESMRLDDQLRNAVAKNDVETIYRFCCTFRPYLDEMTRRILRHHAPEDASDVVHEAIVHALEKLDTLTGKSWREFKAWILVSVRNRALNLLRKASKKKPFPEDPANDMRLAKQESTPSERVARREQAELVLQAIDELSEHEKAIVKMRFFAGRTAKDIAEQMNIKPDAVRQQCHRALQKLKKVLGDQDVTIQP